MVGNGDSATVRYVLSSMMKKLGLFYGSHRSEEMAIRDVLDGKLKPEELAVRLVVDIRALDWKPLDELGPFTDYESYFDCTMLSRCLGVIGEAPKNAYGLPSKEGMDFYTGAALAGVFLELAMGDGASMDIDGLKLVHKTMFKALFPWAGSLRTCEIPDVENESDPYLKPRGVPCDQIEPEVRAILGRYDRDMSDDASWTHTAYLAWQCLGDRRPFLYGSREAAAALIGLDALRRGLV